MSPRMRRAGAVILAVVLTLGAQGAALSRPDDGPPIASEIDPALAALLDGLPASAMVGTIVILRDQLDLRGIDGQRRQERQQRVVTALRDHAFGSQFGLRLYLARQRAEGAVFGYTPYWIQNAIAVSATPRVIRELARWPDVSRIEPDYTLAAPLPTGAAPAGTVEPNIALVGATALWDIGNRGQGTVVASLDTGVDWSHPDLASRWRGGSNSWYDPNGQHPAEPFDANGHGTETMGIIVGGDAGGSAIGLAPDAKWIAAKIFDDSGVATTSEIHAAFQWLLDPDGVAETADAPDVVNASWTFAAPGCNLTFQPDLEALVAAGIVPVFAAGNFGPGISTDASPANNPGALSVGAVDNADLIDASSSRGPTSCGGSARTYPDLVAPGVDIRTSDLYSGYASGTGTSLAAPHVTGAVALLRSGANEASVAQLRSALAAGAVDLGAPGSDDNFGSGRLDIYASYLALTGGPSPTPSPTPTPTPTSSSPPPDMNGPLTTGLVVAPNPADGSTDVVVAAVVDDVSIGNSPVVAAELFVDAIGPSGTGRALDGAFGVPSVTVTGAVPRAQLAGLSDGPHTIFVHGRDALGNWGGVAGTVLAIDRAGPSISAAATTPYPTAGSQSVTITATARSQSSIVSGAEWYVGADSAPAGGPMMPGDGSFDSAVEAIWGIASLAGLGYGEHLVNVRARNPLGTWGDGGAAVISITPVDGIFADGFESGDLSAWSSATGGAQLTVESGAAMAGGYGLVTRLSGKSAAYVADASPAAATAYRARFWFAPRGTVTGVKPIDIFVGRSSAAAIFRVQYQHASGGELRVRLGIARKRGTAYSGWIAISDTAHAIELAWSSSAAATVWLHLDGTVADAVIGLNTSAYRLESVLIGPSGGMSASASGSLWFDGLVSTESTAIGL